MSVMSATFHDDRSAPSPDMSPPNQMSRRFDDSSKYAFT
jgi:hypothetical protein